jgi:hypothetical protein
VFPGRSILRLAVLCCAAPSFAQVNVLTVNYDISRTSANLNETILNPSVVNADSFGKLWDYPVDGQIYAQPLYAGQLGAGGQTRSVLYVATMHNSLYAFDADQPPEAALLWMRNFGPSVPNTFYNFNDIQPEIGILGTPVIDLAGGIIYLVANTLENGVCFYRLHALDLSTGAEKPGSPVVIGASVPGNAPDAVGGMVNFNASDHLQRPGLLLLNGVVYIALGSHGDILPYHGWILGYEASSLRQVAAFNTTPNGAAGSVWQAGHGIAADDQGNLYAIAANGDYDGASNWGESFLKLSTQNGLSVTDWFTPDTWANLNQYDAEIGNSGPVLVPGTDLVVGGGKLGNIYLLNRSQMGHSLIGNVGAVQTFQVVNFGLFSRALWNRASDALFYVSGWGDPVQAFRLSNGKFDETPVSKTVQGYAQPYLGMAISGDGVTDDSTILWVTAADQVGQPVPGTLRAFDATDLSIELWNSDVNAARDSLGIFAKFAIPTVADGKVYVPTFSNQLAVYGLLRRQPRLTVPVLPRHTKQ